MRFRSIVMLLVLLLTAGACSVVDGGDQDDFEQALVKVPKEERQHLAVGALAWKVKQDLGSRPQNEQAIKTECRTRLLRPDLSDEENPWGAWSAEGQSWTAADLLDCVERGYSYATCLSAGAGAIVAKARSAYAKAIKLAPEGSPLKGVDFQCRSVVDPGYAPSVVKGATDDVNRVSAEDILRWLLSSPVQPSGFSPTMWEALGPVLCGLGAGWGCTRDSNPIINPGSSSPGGDP